MNRFTNISQLYLRIAIGTGYLVFGLDRLGCWGPHGSKNVAWGDWQHFMEYAQKVMSFLPLGIATVFAITATVAEIILGALLLVGKWTKPAALASGVLALLFALSMAISFGIVSPLSYSVFTLSAASFLLATVDQYTWSLDNLSVKKNAHTHNNQLAQKPLTT